MTASMRGVALETLAIANFQLGALSLGLTHVLDDTPRIKGGVEHHRCSEALHATIMLQQHITRESERILAMAQAEFEKRREEFPGVITSSGTVDEALAKFRKACDTGQL